MGNPFNVLNGNSPMGAFGSRMGDMQTFYNAIVNAKNPMQAFQGIARSNPALKPIADALGGGADPYRLFCSMCSQRGIDPNEFMKAITGRNGRF